MFNKTVYSIGVAVLSFCFLYGCNTNKEIGTDKVLLDGTTNQHQSKIEDDCDLNGQGAKTAAPQNITQSTPSPKVTLSDGPLIPPTIFFPKERHNFGKVLAGSKLTHKFEFANMGEDPLEIIHVQTSCGCTTSKLSQKTLQSGQSTELEITYNVGSDSGKKTRIITVISNDPKKPKLPLTLTANIQPNPNLKAASKAQQTAQKPTPTDQARNQAILQMIANLKTNIQKTKP